MYNSSVVIFTYFCSTLLPLCSIFFCQILCMCATSWPINLLLGWICHTISIINCWTPHWFKIKPILRLNHRFTSMYITWFILFFDKMSPFSQRVFPVRHRPLIDSYKLLWNLNDRLIVRGFTRRTKDTQTEIFKQLNNFMHYNNKYKMQNKDIAFIHNLHFL